MHPIKPLIYVKPVYIQNRYHAPGMNHSHHHSHEHSSEELGQNNEKVTRYGVYSNVVLTGLKFGAGYATNSVVLIADAIHSLTDLLSDFITYFTIKYSRLNPTKNFPYGFGKIDTLGSLSVTGMLAIASYHIITHSINEMYNYEDLESMLKFPMIGISAAIISILVKEWLYRITIKAGNESHSNVTIVNAWHHRSDAMTSVVSLIGIGGVILGFPISDPLCGGFVGLYLLKIALHFMKVNVYELLDHSIGDQDDAIKQIILNVNGVNGVNQLITKKSGIYRHVCANILIEPDMKMIDAQNIVNNVKTKLKSNTGLHIQHLIIVPIIPESKIINE